MHLAILLENMRREGYEVQVSQPQVITRKINGVLSEPFEEAIVSIPSQASGLVIKKLSQRGGRMLDLQTHGNQVRLIFAVPTRGLLGYRGEFMIDTRGEGILTSRVTGFKPHAGEIQKRAVGSMISMVTGKSLAYSLDNLQTRGQLY